jgi:hypothetical protein
MTRTASLAALAAAVGLIALAAPSWSCPTRGGSSGSGGNASQGSDMSRDNGAGERQREGVDAAASEGMDDPAVVGARGSESDTVQVPTAQIGAVSQARASGDAAQCRVLKAQIAALTSSNAPNPYAEVNSAQLYFSRITQMTPDKLDAEIAFYKEQVKRAQLMAGMGSIADSQQMNAIVAAANQKLSLLVPLRAAQAVGFSVEDVRAKAADQFIAATKVAEQAVANTQAQIRDLNAQMHDLGCDTLLPTTSASNP